MYTQCPDCSTAFRVTAPVLKQAAGQVRCGGCGIAFNALEFLSEAKPDEAVAREHDAPPPELTAEPRESEDGSPITISASQSAALLKTLDELEGSDIRIEDTGVEWRVLDDDAMSDMEVDELLDESPTPVDEFLTKTPSDVEAGEIFEESANAFAQTPVEELRFDDNTPLPDDFDLDDESSYLPDSTQAEPSTVEANVETDSGAERLDETEESQIDIALGEPDEWADILGEVAELSKPYVAPLEAELAAIEDSDEPLDVDTQFALQAEAMGIDLSGLHQSPDDQPEEPSGQTVDEPDQELAIESDEEPAEEPVTERDDEPEEEPAIEPEGESEEEPDGELEEEPAIEPDEEPEGELEDEPDEEPEGELEEEHDDEMEEEPAIEPDEQPEGELEEEPDAELEEETEEESAIELDDESEEMAELEVDTEPEDEATRRHALDEAADEEEAPLEFGTISTAMAELDEQSNVFDDDFFVDEEALELDDEDEIRDEIEDQQPGLADDEESSFHVPPQTEEEQTLNLMIDEELLNLAVEDEDGFASTIVIAEKETESAGAAKKERLSVHAGMSADFESIVMEGEFVRSELDAGKREADIAAAAELREQGLAARNVETATPTEGRSRAIVGALVALTLLFLAQLAHQSRETLATIPAFNTVIGPVYRAIGKPVSPAWDVTGWSFEATQPKPDDGNEQLAILSRIANKSDDPLPYPLINIALIDRYEEPIGSHTLIAADYLADDSDPAALVQAGNTFTAVISIPSPAEEATGYKLKVCYRLSTGRLRCNNPDFR